jgi:hypothetical protein
MSQHLKELDAMPISRPFPVVLAALTAVFCVVVVGVPHAKAQGCVASRMNAPSVSGATDPEGNSYYLPDGRWQASFGYRNFRSHRHFVGSVEQDGSPGTVDRSKNEVVNNVNIPELAVSYGFSDRLSATLDLPVDVLHRRNPQRAASANSPAVPFVYTDARGIGDATLVTRFWVGNPSHHGSQNLSVGLGFKVPTGKDDVNGTFLRVVNRTVQPWIHPVDQSIQLGDGGFGIIAELQAFKSFGSVTAFATGSYLANPRGTNGVPTGRSDPNEAIMSVADQYGARVGITMPVRFLKGVGFSLDARLEGVPSSDLIGSSAGFRRPGYSIGVEPGLSYSWKKTAFSVSVPYLVRRVRSQSYADKLATAATGTFVNGDAAFADYIVIAGFTRRF